jgi:hypothetical protein
VNNATNLVDLSSPTMVVRGLTQAARAVTSRAGSNRFFSVLTAAEEFPG